jgi:hypothetical protein
MRWLLVTALCVIVGLGVTGCTAEQLAEQQQLQQTTNESFLLVQQVWADANMTDAQKVKATAAISSQYAEKAGLISAEDNQTFMGVVELAWNTYWAWTPGGLPKMDIGLYGALISIAIVWLRSGKKK